MSELRKPPMLASTRLGDVIIDFANYRLISNKKQSKIEPRVMAVLQVLLDNAGEAVSRDTFIDEVWDGNALSDDALNRTISILRRELRAFGYDGLVKTIPKRGYRLDYPDQTAPGMMRRSAKMPRLNRTNTGLPFWAGLRLVWSR